MKRIRQVLGYFFLPAVILLACGKYKTELHPKVVTTHSIAALSATVAVPQRSYSEVWVDDFGAVGYDPAPGVIHAWPNPHGMVDSSAAIQAAFDRVTKDGVVRFRHCKYWIGQTLTVKTPMAIVVSASTDRVTDCGFAVKYGIVGLVLDAPTTVRGLWMRADGRPTVNGVPGTIDPAAHGILMEETSHLAGVNVSLFEGDGIHIEASVPAHNANDWRIEGGATISNHGFGLYVRGSDVNAGLAERLSAIGNLLGNFHDNSFLGNTYLACHTDGTHNAYESGWDYVNGVRTENRNNRNMFLNCYQEDGTTADLGSGTIWIGGMGQAITTGNGSVLKVDGNGFQSPHFTAAPIAGNPVARLGSGSTSPSSTTVMEWWTPKSKTPVYVYPTTSTARAGGIDISHAMGSSKVSATVSTSSSADGPGFVEAPDGIRVGASTIVAMGAQPLTGKWRVGDVVVNSAAAATKPWAWQCVQAGTPGVWRALTGP